MLKELHKNEFILAMKKEIDGYKRGNTMKIFISQNLKE